MTAPAPDPRLVTRETLAWIIHRASGCGPMVGFPGQPDGPICEPDNEDWDAADNIIAAGFMSPAEVEAHVQERIAEALKPASCSACTDLILPNEDAVSAGDRMAHRDCIEAGE